MTTRSQAPIGVLVTILFTAGNEVAAATLYVSQTNTNPTPRNRAGRAGGGVYVDGCEMDRCVIVGNGAGGQFISAGLGGGIFATN